MRRSIFLAAVLTASCVSVEPAPDPRGTVKPAQRIVVLVHQSPGPWIVADPDSKAETALKLLPLGTFLQGMQEDRINEISKEIQPYLPRPRYDQAVEAAVIRTLKATHGGAVQTFAEAGLSPAQRREWNAAEDQLAWRRKYYFTDAGKTTPRDYAKILSLDDAVILDVNVSFGLEPNEEERTLPLLSAASRLYRADTDRMLWSREERLSDTTSSATLTEFRADPKDLTDRLIAMADPLGVRIAQSLAREANLLPAAASVTVISPPQSSTEPVTAQPPVTEQPPAPQIQAPPPAPFAPPPPDLPPPDQRPGSQQGGLPTH